MNIDLGLPEILRFLAELRRTRAPGGGKHRVSGEGDLGAVGGNRGESCNGSVIGELLLLGTVVIHGPDLFVPGAFGNEVYFGSDQTGGAELLQDVGREFLGHLARSGFVERA